MIGLASTLFIRTPIVRNTTYLQRGEKNFFPYLKFPPHFCQAKWPAHAQAIGPDGTCITKISSINFARPCRRSPRPTDGRATSTPPRHVGQQVTRCKPLFRRVSAPPSQPRETGILGAPLPPRLPPRSAWKRPKRVSQRAFHGAAAAAS